MAIEFQCITCGKLLRVADAAAGKQARCPACGAIQNVVAIPGPEIPPPIPPGSPPPTRDSTWSPHGVESAPPLAPPGKNPFSDGASAPSPFQGEGNPYAASATPNAGVASQPFFTGPAAKLYAQNKLRVPAILMLVISVVAVVIGLFGVVASIVAMANGRGQSVIEHIQFFLLLGFHAAIIYGATGMLSLKRYHWALAAVCLSLLPCSGCCVVSFPIGIWGLVILNEPTVRNAFE